MKKQKPFLPFLVLTFLRSLLTVAEEPDRIHPMGKRGQSEHNKSKTAAAKEIPKALDVFDSKPLAILDLDPKKSDVVLVRKIENRKKENI